MNLVQRLEHWGDAHHPKYLDLLRIALGIFLCFKGIEFLNNMGAMMNLMDARLSFGSLTLVIIGHYIVFAHIIGGFLLVLGLLTRFACLIQIPILLGAVILINLSSDMLRPFSELALSIIVLLLLIYFLIIGNGPWSFDYFLDREPESRSAAGHGTRKQA
jgi:putative oxidoreductase